MYRWVIWMIFGASFKVFYNTNWIELWIREGRTQILQVGPKFDHVKCISRSFTIQFCYGHIIIMIWKIFGDVLQVSWFYLIYIDRRWFVFNKCMIGSLNLCSKFKFWEYRGCIFSLLNDKYLRQNLYHRQIQPWVHLILIQFWNRPTLALSFPIFSSWVFDSTCSMPKKNSNRPMLEILPARNV